MTNLKSEQGKVLPEFLDETGCSISAAILAKGALPSMLVASYVKKYHQYPDLQLLFYCNSDGWLLISACKLRFPQTAQ